MKKLPLEIINECARCTSGMKGSLKHEETYYVTQSNFKSSNRIMFMPYLNKPVVMSCDIALFKVKLK